MGRSKKMLALLLVQLFVVCINAQSHEINMGLRLQKSVHLYWENGVAIDYASERIMKKQLHLGASYCSSRLGTAINSNAIKQDNYLVTAAYLFRKDKIWQPITKLNVGYFVADMEYEMFEVLPHQSALLSFEAGVGVKLKYPVRLSTSLGYNFITGDGISGPGTLYPLFYQFTLQYVFNL